MRRYLAEIIHSVFLITRLVEPSDIDPVRSLDLRLTAQVACWLSVSEMVAMMPSTLHLSASNQLYFIQLILNFTKQRVYFQEMILNPNFHFFGDILNTEYPAAPNQC